MKYAFYWFAKYSYPILKLKRICEWWVYFDGTRVARRQLVYNDISASFVNTLTNARNGSLETQAEECVVS